MLCFCCYGLGSLVLDFLPSVSKFKQKKINDKCKGIGKLGFTVLKSSGLVTGLMREREGRGDRNNGRING